MHKLELSVHFV